jgi:hypothetical protein
MMAMIEVEISVGGELSLRGSRGKEKGASSHAVLECDYEGE